MTTHQKLAESLVVCQNEIISRWEKTFLESERFTLFQLTGNVKGVLRYILNDVTRFVQEDDTCFTRPEIREVPLSATMVMVRVIIRGETCVVAVIRDYLNVSDEEWLFLRKKLNRAFHEVLCAYTGDVCGMCCNAVKEKFSQALGFKAILEKSLNG